MSVFLNMKTIVFLSGFSIPTYISKSKLFFDDSMWEGYHRVFYSSKTPSSDTMVEKELNNLNSLVNSFSYPIVIGHSLGAWWATNLACNNSSNIKKLVLWTPLCDVNMYPIFNASRKYHPINRVANKHNTGLHNTLVCYANNDLIVPHIAHAQPLISQFNASSYELNGGHAYQIDHKSGLSFVKDWIELEDYIK